jgi:two-component system response regulator FixJ
MRRRAQQHDPMTDAGGPIHLVLPDPIERAACFRALAAGAGGIIRSFASADDYLDAGAAQGSAILLFHWRQPGRVDGEALLHHVAARTGILSFVAAERLSLAESAAILRGGARDLLPAPLDPRIVRRTLDHALGEWRAHQQARELRHEAEARLAALTPREHDILDAIAAGLGNKAIARRLDLSPRTVEVHRANIMRRAGTTNVAELLRLRFITEYARGTGANPVRFGA